MAGQMKTNPSIIHRISPRRFYFYLDFSSFILIIPRRPLMKPCTGCVLVAFLFQLFPRQVYHFSLFFNPRTNHTIMSRD